MSLDARSTTRRAGLGPKLARAIAGLVLLSVAVVGLELHSLVASSLFSLRTEPEPDYANPVVLASAADTSLNTEEATGTSQPPDPPVALLPQCPHIPLPNTVSELLALCPKTATDILESDNPNAQFTSLSASLINVTDGGARRCIPAHYLAHSQWHDQAPRRRPVANRAGAPVARSFLPHQPQQQNRPAARQRASRRGATT